MRLLLRKNLYDDLHRGKGAIRGPRDMQVNHCMEGSPSLKMRQKLSRLAISVFRHHSDLVTFKFMIKTLALGLKRGVPGS